MQDDHLAYQRPVIAALHGQRPATQARSRCRSRRSTALVASCSPLRGLLTLLSVGQAVAVMWHSSALGTGLVCQASEQPVMLQLHESMLCLLQKCFADTVKGCRHTNELLQWGVPMRRVASSMGQLNNCRTGLSVLYGTACVARMYNAQLLCCN
jgi:hypothetical protein